MRAWLYARLSNDDDPDMHSLTNQQKIIRDYANEKSYMIVGESADDNVSGMSFDRRGLDQLTDAVEAGQVDAVIVKDLSRLGRHQIQTALYIDYLRQKRVAVISVTEGLCTLNEQDDLIIGLRGLMNDFYAKDIGNKIRHGYREKQKAGIVITPPFGYIKDKNTNSILLHPEASETVKLIYGWYLDGCGQKEIARRLNCLGRKTPAQIQAERYGKDYYTAKKTEDGQYIWDYSSVKNILADESYAGVLINHKRETRSGKSVLVEKNNQYRHEEFFPAIISRDVWNAVQILLRANVKNKPQNKPSHRYAGLLTCGDCGNVFVPVIRHWNGRERVEYVCCSYHRGGKALCSSHRIHEEKIDAYVREYDIILRERWITEQKKWKQMQMMWDRKRVDVQKEIQRLKGVIDILTEDIEDILMEKIKNSTIISNRHLS